MTGPVSPLESMWEVGLNYCLYVFMFLGHIWKLLLLVFIYLEIKKLH